MNESLNIEIRDSLGSIEPAQWNALRNDGNPFLQHEFLHALESTGCLGQATGWFPRYFLLWSGPESSDESTSSDASETSTLCGAVPAYVKTNSHGEFVFDWSWADAYQRHQMPYYPKLVSSIPFTPVTGRRLLVHPDQPYADTVRLLAAAMRQFSLSEEYSSVHFLFVTEQESALLSERSPAPSDTSKDDSDSDSDSDIWKRKRSPETHRLPIPLAQLGLSRLRCLSGSMHFEKTQNHSARETLRKRRWPAT